VSRAKIFSSSRRSSGHFDENAGQILSSAIFSFSYELFYATLKHKFKKARCKSGGPGRDFS